MADKGFVELKQEEVFSYIDAELKKEQSPGGFRYSQKTKSILLPILAVNTVAVIIALVSFIFIYNNFKSGQYRLVGSENSIKGLEDVVFQEMRKKANADLIRNEQA